MIVVMGATGNVGATVADALLARGEAVTILTRHPQDAGDWSAKGAQVAQADAEDAASLHAAFRRADRAFLLNPPAARSSDTNATELRTIANILAALEGSGLEKVVAASTYGAQAGDAIGDLSTLWTFEEGLRAQVIPAAINRGAYYMTNWLGFTEVVRATGKLPSMFPEDTEMPMVAPADLGLAAVERLLSPAEDTAMWYIEGPARYTPRQVAQAFEHALGPSVALDVAPRTTWESVFIGAGFSPEAAAAYARMAEVSLASDFDKPAEPRRGGTDLDTLIQAAVTSS